MFRHGGRERKRERGERERNINVINKHRSVASDMSPDWGSDVQCSNPLSHLVRAKTILFENFHILGFYRPRNLHLLCCKFLLIVLPL